jgi:hypothetical protein
MLRIASLFSATASLLGKRAKGGAEKGLRRTPRRPADVTGIVPEGADSVPESSRTAFRASRQSVRHPAGTLSAMPPEWCPPSVRNRVRHGPERAVHPVSVARNGCRSS